MLQVKDIIAAIEAKADPALAEDWDQPGLAFGSYEAGVNRVLLALDITPAVVERALEENIDLLILHHPPLFQAVHYINDSSIEGQMYLTLIRENIACYSAHTNLDRSPIGTSQGLIKRLDLAVNGSWQILEKLADYPEFGYGAYADLSKSASFIDFAQLIAERCGIEACQRYSANNADVKRIALFPGSFDESFINRLEDLRVDVLISGEIKHHVALMLEARDIHPLIIGHDVSERDSMKIVASYLNDTFNDLSIAVDTGINYN